MRIIVNTKKVEDLKNELGIQRGFKEQGGYLLGRFNGIKYEIEKFLIDTNAQSTSTRIKLSAEAFREVEEINEKNHELQYIGTWHIHPGMTKPLYSVTDVNSLFLERLIIDTDNPEQFTCPKIHLIFNSDLSQLSCFTLKLDIEMIIFELKSILIGQIVQQGTLNKIITDLSNSKQLIERINNSPLDEKNIDDIYSNLLGIKAEIGNIISRIDFGLEIRDFHDIFTRNESKIMSHVISEIKNGTSIGILINKESNKIQFEKYRPKFIKMADDNDNILGFWKFLEYENTELEFDKIFMANFVKKLELPNENYLFIKIFLKKSKKIEDPREITLEDLIIVPIGFKVEEDIKLNYIEIEPEIIQSLIEEKQNES